MEIGRRSRIIVQTETIRDFPFRFIDDTFVAFSYFSKKKILLKRQNLVSVYAVSQAHVIFYKLHLHFDTFIFICFIILVLNGF